MSKIGVLVAVGLTGVAVLGLQAPGLAQQNIQIAQTTDRALLEALVERRADVAQSATASHDKRAALAFLDKRIAEATDPALLEALLERRAEVAQSATASDDKRAALTFLDKRIHEVRLRIRHR